MTLGVILAGGLGSRLGSYSATRSKALVSVGVRPHLAKQVQDLRTSGCDRVVVVTSPATDEQVRGVAARAGIEVETEVQERPTGPLKALAQGLQRGRYREQAVVLMADTWLSSNDPLPSGDWVATAPAPSTRYWYYYDELGRLREGVAEEGVNVSIGAYGFSDAYEAYSAAVRGYARRFRGAGEVGMVESLRDYEVTSGRTFEQLPRPDWRDLGDLRSLHAFRRGSAPGMRLGELWLYWPGRPDTWHDVAESVLGHLLAFEGPCSASWDDTALDVDTGYVSVAPGDVTDLAARLAVFRAEYADGLLMRRHGLSVDRSAEAEAVDAAVFAAAESAGVAWSSVVSQERAATRRTTP